MIERELEKTAEQIKSLIKTVNANQVRWIRSNLSPLFSTSRRGCDKLTVMIYLV